ncbi:MAG: transketolase family protein [Erysipelotrichaceae bacterium]|nr:transketolase family protein [Erysipelotrichaceae bacterium]
MVKATREAYGEALAELVKENAKVVVLDADVAGSTKSAIAQKAVPERFFDMGIAEADMIGHAAGLAASGYIPFASSFAMFATGRAWEQIRNSLAYPQLNVKVCGSHAGITVGEDGESHQAIEDIAIIRAIPGMRIMVPADAAETKAVVKYAARIKGPVYIRTGRVGVADVYDDNKHFDFSKINAVRKGTKVAVFACGIMVSAALQAAEILKVKGIDLTVVDVCCIKPIDEEGVVEVLKNHDEIFTVEEHNVIGGLGGLICEIASERVPRPIHRMGMKDRFAESGPWKDLLVKYGLDGDGVAKEILEHLK